MNGKSENRTPLLMFVSSMLIFGTIGIFRRYIPVSSALLTLFRGLLGGLFLLAFTKLRKGKVREKLPLPRLAGLALTGAFIGFNWILLFEAYNHTTVAVATLCYYMQPTIVVLLSPLIFREKLTGKKLICAGAAVIGMVLVSGVLDGTGSGSLRGVLLGLGAAVFYSAVVIMNKKITGVDPWQKTTVQLLSAGLVMIPYLLVTGGFSADGFSLSAILLILVVGIAHTGFAYVLYFGSMDRLSVQSVALLSYIDPVSALLFSAVFLSEPLSPAGLLGALLIIGSAVFSEMSGRKPVPDSRISE